MTVAAQAMRMTIFVWWHVISNHPKKNPGE